MKKHVGKIKNTDQRCAVVFMQIPNTRDQALIVSLDNLPPQLAQNVMEVIESREGQAEVNLADALARRAIAETRKSVLQTLHDNGHLVKMPVDNVVMTPEPHVMFPLRQILETLGRLDPNPVSAQTNDKFNRHVAQVEARRDDERLGIARNLIAEAELLESEARRKRDQAYTYAPHMRPGFVADALPASAEEDAKVAIVPLDTDVLASEPTGTTEKSGAKRTQKGSTE